MTGPPFVLFGTLQLLVRCQPCRSKYSGILLAAGQHAVPAGHKRVQGSGHPLAGGSPAASVAVLSGGAYAAGEATSDCGVAYEYDPEYIDRK